MSEPPPPTVTYWAISILSSRTMWWNAANLIVALLSLTEIAVLVPIRFVPVQVAVVAAINLWLRTVTTRPVALIAAGASVPVEVRKLGPPPPPPLVTD